MQLAKRAKAKARVAARARVTGTMERKTQRTVWRQCQWTARDGSRCNELT